jgi:hypothetical protein
MMLEFFSLISTLLVFVFDGKTPALKRITVVIEMRFFYSGNDEIRKEGEN